MKRHLAVLLLAYLGVSCAWSEVDAADILWATTLQTKDLETISEMIEHFGATPWPKLISDQSAEKNGDKLARPSVLGLALLDDIGRYEQSTPHTESDSIKAISVYSSLSRGLQNSGGYVNLCLADSVNRLALARLTKIVLQDPSSSVNAQSLLEKLSCSHFSLDTFTTMMGEESSLKLKQGVDLSNLQLKDAQSQILAALGTDSAHIEYLFITKQAGTKKLITTPSVGILLQRMGQTEIVDQVFLAALLDYKVHGGRYGDLRSEDIAPFQKIMNGREKLYKSDVMGLSQTNLGTVLGLKNQFERDGFKDMFTDIALE